MSDFPRIHPDHPLTVATREIDDYAADHDIEHVVLHYLGDTCSAGELAYLGEQRALRAAIVHLFRDQVSVDKPLSAELFRKVQREDWWYKNREILITLYANGVLTGWRGHSLR